MTAYIFKNYRSKFTKTRYFKRKILFFFWDGPSRSLPDPFPVDPATRSQSSLLDPPIRPQEFLLDLLRLLQA